MTYDPRDYALCGNEIVVGLSLWVLVVLAGCLAPRSFEAAPDRMAHPSLLFMASRAAVRVGDLAA